MFRDALLKVMAKTDLSAPEAAAAMDDIVEGRVAAAQVAGLLVGLAMKGERPDEIVGFASSMRERAVHIPVEPGVTVDLCGTGGDGSGSFNISSAAAIVAAACGATVAKHGNRSVSSRCGSADVFEALGVDLVGKTGHDRAVPEGVGHRVSVRARDASVDAQRGVGAARAGRADRVQPARPAHQPHAARLPDRRGAEARADRTDRTRARAAWFPAGLGGARRRRPRRTVDHGLFQGVGVPGWRSEDVLRAPVGRRACRRRRRRRWLAAMPA